MTYAELLRFGKDNRYMCSPYGNLGKPPQEAFFQFRETWLERRRRATLRLRSYSGCVNGGDTAARRSETIR